MNENNQQHSAFRRWGRRIAWTLLAILLLVLLARLSLKTQTVQQWVKNFVVSKANQQLNAKLSIDRLSGDLWSEATLSGIRLVQQDTIARIDSVHADYDIWAALGGKIELSNLGIYSLQANLIQKKDRWNIQNMVTESSDTSGGILPFAIDNLVMKNGSVSVKSDSFPADSNFVVNDITISSRLGYQDENYDVTLRDLSFQIENTKLDQPLRVKTSASAKNNRITLEKLVFATGTSVIQSKGYADPIDSTLQFDLSAQPISWRDITSYASDFPLRQNAQINLAVKGKPEQFEVMVSMEADGVESLEISTQLQWKSSLVVRQIQANAQYLSLRELFSDTTLPSLQDLNAEFSGLVDVANYQQGKGDLSFSAKEVGRSPYQLDTVTGNGSIEGQYATLKLDLRQNRQQVKADVQIDQLWSALPSVSATLQAANIDPSFWMGDTSYAGNLNFRSQISGRGWYPQENAWQYSLNMNDSRFVGQSIVELSAKGHLSENFADLDGRLIMQKGRVDFRADIQDINENPKYSYSIITRDLDLGLLMGSKDFATALNSKIEGSGRGVDPETMQLQTAVSVDSSLINKELLRNFSADIFIRDSIAKVDSARLQSTIANGSFSGQLNILRHLDPKNKLDFDLNLKDLDALAPLAGVEDMQAEGEIKGQLTPMEDQSLRFLGTLDLSDIKYNELFTAERARGSLELRNQKKMIYLADLDLSAPTFSGAVLQDLGLITEGQYADSLARGKFEFKFSSTNEERIEQAGTYTLTKDSARVYTTALNIISDYHTLRLEKPFELNYRNDTLRVDTMRVSSGGEAYLEISLPVVSAGEQRGYIQGKSLNTAVIQSCLLGKSYFKGLLSGRFEMARKDTNLDASGELLVSELEYQEARFDSLLISGQIMNERLKGFISVRQDGKQIMDGEANLPFKLGDPETLPPSFFEEPVSGQIRLRDITVERYDSLFAATGITQTSGTFSFRGMLTGRAGQPEFSADASLRNASLSGVAVDSVTAGVDYRHQDAELQLNASVMSLRQKAANISARFPLFINMKKFHVDLPEAKDSVEVTVETNNFNLKALNDFLNRRTLRQVTGRMDGLIQVKGLMGDLKTDGKLVLRNGGFRLVPVGINVDDIRTTIQFDHDQVWLFNLSAQSGKGNLEASGTMALEKLVPGELDIRVKAQNFRAANTSQYNAVVNMDARAQGRLTQPKVTGSLDFLSGFIKLQNFGEKSVETIELDSLEDNAPDISMYDSLAMDMDLAFNRRFFIRNQRYLDMEIELDGELDLIKESGGDLEIFGTINTPNGYARPFGKQFELEEGNIAFSGPPANPQMMVRTRYEPPQTQENVIIWYVIEGTVEDPQFKYESQPPMELENIISYTLFGQPFYALDSWKQVVASSGSNTTVSDVALDVLLDRVEALATQKLGIDVVKIDNSRVGGETGTSITTGWYINPKVFFAIQNVITGSTPDTGFMLEYSLQKNLKLILRQGNGIRQGADIKWSYDY